MNTKRSPESSRENEHYPHITFEFFLSPHGVAADFKDLDVHFKYCDIYVPEAAQWEPSHYQDVVNLTEGKYKPEALDKPQEERTAAEEENVILYNSKKPVVFIDIPKGGRIEAYSLASKENMEVAYKAFCFGSYTEALGLAGKSIKLSAIYTNTRDTYMAEQLNKIEKVFDLHPELKKKKAAKVLVHLGTIHKNVVEKIDPRFSALYSESGETLYDKATVDLINKEAISNDRVVRVLFEYVLRRAFNNTWKLLNNTAEESEMIKKLVKLFTVKEIKGIANSLTGTVVFEEDETKVGQEKVILKKLIENKIGVKLPETKEEVESFSKVLGY